MTTIARRHGPLACVLVAGLVWFSAAVWINLAEHLAFNSTSRDLGVYTQVLWNTGHGRPYQTTLLEANRVHLAEHVSPLLALAAPAYALRPSATWLLVAQVAALTGAGIPVYLLARRRLGPGWLAALPAIGYFAMPTLDEVAFDSIYPVTSAALPASWATYFALTDRPRRAVALGLMTILFEEQGALFCLGLGAVMLWSHRQWAVALLGPAVVWLVVTSALVMPRLHEPSTLSGVTRNRAAGHFEPWLQDPRGAFTAFAAERAPIAIRWLVAPTGGTALLAPQTLAIAAPHAAVLLLADKENRLRRHWVAPMLPVIWLSTVVGLSSLRRPATRHIAVVALLVGAVTCYVADSSLPGGGDFEPDDVVATPRSRELEFATAWFDQRPGLSIAASRRAVGHVANRPGVYVFPPSYQGRLWPPDRPVEAYLLDLSNDQTARALTERPSLGKLAAVFVGPDTLMLVPWTGAPSLPGPGGDSRLVGHDARRVDSRWEVLLYLRWTDSDPPIDGTVFGLTIGDLLAFERPLLGLRHGAAWPSLRDVPLVIERVTLPALASRVGAEVQLRWPDGRSERHRLELSES